MGESLLKEDPLSRIQREIIEVTEREREFKEGHFRINRLLSESTIDVNHQNGHVNGDSDLKPQKTLNRAVSTSHLLGPIAPSPPIAPTLLNTNGYTRRFTPQTGTKGIMQRFIANKGKLPASPGGGPIPQTPTTPMTIAPPLVFPTSPVITPVVAPPVISRTPEGKPVRKGYVPVEEKIQKELQEMKDREHELKKMRKKQKPFDLELSDNETTSESEDEEIPMPGKLKATKSIGELYEALNEELRSPSPRNSSGHESIGSLKPAKSLAELCVLAPGEEFLAPSSTRLIAKWESLIQQKQEAGAA
ncbi:mitotic spindle positioning protein meduse [Anticarsia gemmatalis]|uniref:mitotic spindle positioning protein meduse n=1 Tax=Anticarsia gemmatalis TaxID=129554 RepID=UPI003F774064